jgi:lipopolysaccharide export LptBFGC system permease protein LptF
MISLATFGNRPQLQPHLLAWVPNLVCQGAGLWGLWRKR